MSKQTSAMFLESGGAPIQLGDLLVHPVFSWRLEPGVRGTIAVSFGPSESPLAQGLRLFARDVQLHVGPHRSRNLVIWDEDAREPAIADLAFAASRKGGELRFVNVWRRRDEDDMQTSHSRGNYGMVVRGTAPGELVLRCSDGEGPFDPNDALIRVCTSVTRE